MREAGAPQAGARVLLLDDDPSLRDVLSMVLDEIDEICERVGNNPDLELTELREILPAEDIPTEDEIEDLGAEFGDEMLAVAEERYETLEGLIGEENMRKVEHWLLLESIDFHWREHLTAIDDLRQSIGLQAYAQVDPLVAFKREGYDMHQQLQGNIRRQVARTVFKVRVEQRPAPGATPAATAPAQVATAPAANGTGDTAPVAEPVLMRSSAPSATALRTNMDEAPAGAAKRGVSTGAATAPAAKLGRNDPCHCGSGKKYKRCHGALQ